MFVAVTGFVVGQNRTTEMNSTQLIARMLSGLLHLPSVYGPSMNWTLWAYT